MLNEFVIYSKSYGGKQFQEASMNSNCDLRKKEIIVSYIHKTITYGGDISVQDML